MKAAFSITRKEPNGAQPGATEGVRCFLSTFARREDGGVAILVGLAAPVLLGFAGLGLEYSQLLVVRAEAQRTADLSSHAGAAAYARTGDETAMKDAGQAIARLNGFADGEIVVQLDPSFPTASGAAVRATITTPKALFLPRILGSDADVDVVASAVAGALGGGSSCVQALDPNGSGITLSGGVSIQSGDCGVASNSKVEVPCGTKIITKTLTYDSNSSPATGGCNTIVKPDGGTTDILRRPTTDPLAGSDPIALASVQMARTAAMPAPEETVTTTGPDIDFAYSQDETKAQAAAAGCSAAFTSDGNAWTFSCPGVSTVNLGNITTGGGITLRFNPGASQNVVYNISGHIRIGSGVSAEFGGGTYNIVRGIEIAGGSDASFGTGAGTGFRLGPSSSGDAIHLAGGADLYMSNGGVDVFEVTGEIYSAGGSCMEIPSADLHEINGSINVSGAVRFGSGLYSINGYMHVGGSNGGSVWCDGETVSIDAQDTTFLISADGPEPTGYGECVGQAFCISAGYQNVRFKAPQSGPFADIAVVGPLDLSRTSGAKFAAGASGSMVSGAFYFPNGPITMSGGADASSGAGDCLQMIGTEVTLSGGTAVASECDLPQSGAVGQVVILQ